MPWRWPRGNPRALAGFVSPKAGDLLGPLGFSSHDLRVLDPSNRVRSIARKIYDALQAQEIFYELDRHEPGEPSESATQLVLQPQEVLWYKRGTCLDLAVLFCGVCLWHELIPVLLVFDDGRGGRHALVAVSLTHELRDCDDRRRWLHAELARNDPRVPLFADRDRLLNAVERSAYLPLEVTGFARGEALAAPAGFPRINGRLSFDGAEAAALEHLRRPGVSLLFALDVAVAQGVWKEPTAALDPELPGPPRDFTRLTELLLEGFVGREFVFTAFEQFRAEERAGYFHLAADAGLGKSAIAASLSRRLGAPAYFFDIGATDPKIALDAVGHELIYRYRLFVPRRSQETPSEYLTRVLTEATQGGRKVVVILDALDEAEESGVGHNWAYLPRQPPPGSYFFLTSRTPERRPDLERHVGWRVFELRTEMPEHQRDVVEYLRRAADRPAIAERLAATRPAVPAEVFVRKLERASEYNFKYLTGVLDDLKPDDSPIDPLALDSLPQGLLGYYQRFWEGIRRKYDTEGWDSWSALYRPVIELLAVAREPVPAGWLAALLGRDAIEVRTRALGAWQRFLSRAGNGAEMWRVVHKSFTDFLAAKPELDLRAAHGRVADRYLGAWGGLQAGLPDLAQPERAALDGGYGLRRLARHLWDAERFGDLCALADEPFLAAQVRFFTSYHDTLETLKLAARAADRLGDRTRSLELALAHAGLKAKLAQLGKQEIIRLYARFGNVARALKLTEEIADRGQWARTQTAVARECFARGDIGAARGLVREVFAQCDGLHHVEAREVLRQVATWLPEEVVFFLERNPTHSMFAALVDSYADLQDGPITDVFRGMPENWQSRLRLCLRNYLSAEPHLSPGLALLLVLLEPDPDSAAELVKLAFAEGARPAAWADPYWARDIDRDFVEVVVQVKRDRRDQPSGSHSSETVKLVTDRLLDSKTGGYETRLLLNEIVVLNPAPFITALKAGDMSLDLKASLDFVYLFIDIGRALVWHTGDVATASDLLEEVIRRTVALPDLASVLDAYRVGDLVREIAEVLARESLEKAQEFLWQKGIPDWWLRHVSYSSVLAAAAETQPEKAEQAAWQLKDWRERNWSLAGIATTVARRNLHRAMVIWDGLDGSNGSRPHALLEVLRNAPPADSPPAALSMLEKWLGQTQPDRSYKMLALAEAAARLSAIDPDEGKRVIVKALKFRPRDVRDTEWGPPWRDLLLLSLVPPLLSSGLQEMAVGTQFDLPPDKGLDGLVEPLILRQLVEAGRSPSYASPSPLEGNTARWMRENLTLNGNKLTAKPDEQMMSRDLIFFSDLADNPSIVSTSRLVSLWLWHAPVEYSWRRDHTKVLWAVNTAATEMALALRVARSIHEKPLQEATLLALAEVDLPRDEVAQFVNIDWEAALRPIALVRQAATEISPAEREKLLVRAYEAATAVLGPLRVLVDWFEHGQPPIQIVYAATPGALLVPPLRALDLDLLLEFLHNAASLDRARAESWGHQLIEFLGKPTTRDALLLLDFHDIPANEHESLRGRGFYPTPVVSAGLVQLTRLRNEFFAPTTAARESLRAMYEAWVKGIADWEDRVIAKGDRRRRFLAQDMARSYTYIARRLLPLDRSRGEELLVSAARYADSEPDTDVRHHLYGETLRALLTIPDGLGWSEAIARSLAFGDTLLHTFTIFARALLDLERGDDAPTRLIAAIARAERLMEL